MDEIISKAAVIDYSAIAETSNTPGFKKLLEMLEYDVKFAQGLLEKPKRPKALEENKNPDPVWIIDMHDIGRARGILSTAKKYIDLINLARNKSKII